MDNEYVRLLNLHSLPDLFDCNCGYVDSEDCSWYHHNWLLLRFLQMVSNPFWHENFYLNALKKYAKPSTLALIIGTADFSMPLLCQQAGLRRIIISDICNTPLNICKNVAAQNGFQWETQKLDIFDGLSGRQYGIIINDAFLSRFSYDAKRIVLERIHAGLANDGVYITTLRHGWNGGGPVIPSHSQKKAFIERAIHVATEKGMNIERATIAATQYIDRMISYPVRDENMIADTIAGLFEIAQIEKATVPGECSPTEYYRVVLRKA